MTKSKDSLVGLVRLHIVVHVFTRSIVHSSVLDTVIRWKTKLPYLSFCFWTIKFRFYVNVTFNDFCLPFLEHLIRVLYHHLLVGGRTWE